MPDEPSQRPFSIDDESQRYPLEKLTGAGRKRRATIHAIHEQTGRVPPQALEVEKSVLGAMLIEPEAIPRAIEILTPDAFYVPKHQEIYRATLSLFERGNPVDLITLTEELKRQSALDDVGGAYYLTELTTSVASAANVEYHARVIAEKALLRKMIETMTVLVGQAYDPASDAFELLDHAEGEIFRISESQLRRPASSLSDVVKETLERLESIHGREGGITGVPSGFSRLDGMTSGWQKSDLIIIAARPSMGKAQPLDAPILTPGGWRTMGELAPGDAVVGADGLPTRVVGVFPQGVKQTYRVRFSDGTSVECCEEHLWHTTTRAERKRGRSGSVRSTAEIAASLTVEEGGRVRQNHQIPYVQPVGYSEQDVPLDPYALGVLLGDGMMRRGGSIGVSTQDRFIVQALEAAVPVAAQYVSGYDYRLTTPYGQANPLKEAVRELGLEGCTSDTKFIPPAYLQGSVAQRHALLQGLMDTDGALANGGTGARLTTVSPRLRDDVVELVRSLGGRATWSSRRTAYRYRGERRIGRESYRVYMTFPNGLCPFRLPRKADRYTGLRRVTGKAIVAVEPCRETACQCIMVDSPDRLYVAEDYNLTHNTAFSLACARNAALHPQHPAGVAIFSLEMSSQQLAQRLLTSEARVDAQAARTGRMTEDDWLRLAHAAGRLSAAPIYIDDTPGLSILELRAKCRRLKAEHDIGLVIVDYLQLMHATTKKNANREQEISQISRSLKSLAKELDVPVIALSQLSRAVETRGGDKRPQLSDLRESGAIEQDADVVAFIYRAERYGITVDENGNSTEGLGEIIIGKQRNGPIGNVQLAFVHQFARFENLTTYYAAGPSEYAGDSGGFEAPGAPVPPADDAPF